MDQRLLFVQELEKLKGVLRATKNPVNHQPENDAEHSFMVAMMAHLFAEDCVRPVNPEKVSKMLLIHDVVEIDAGDTFAYDNEGYETKRERETAAALRIFSLLGERKEEFFSLWEEFEEMETDDALYANAIDRLHPILLNHWNPVSTWEEHGVKKEQVLARLKPVSRISPRLYDIGLDCVNGYFGGE